jgi:hypothetical protein
VALNHLAVTVSDRNDPLPSGEHFDLTERVHDEHLLILGSPGGSLPALSAGIVAAELPRTNPRGFQLRRAEEVGAARERLGKADVPRGPMAGRRCFRPCSGG